MVIKPFYLWKWNGDSVCRHDKKYILKTYDKMIDSTDYLIDEFMQKGMVQQARESAARIIFDTYLLLNKDEWYLEENKEYKEKVENRIKSFY
jgi:dsDNA-binding SOS-regulon protein